MAQRHPRAADGTIDAVNEQRRTPLHLAAAAAASQGVQLLLDHGAAADARDAQGRTALQLACGAASEACVNLLLLAGGAAPNAADIEGQTPLHRCAEVGAVACARALLSAGATVERDHKGDSPLHVAAVHGHVECMKCLVLAGRNTADTPRAADIRQALSDEPPMPPATKWVRYAYEDGTPYWYNPVTDASQWHEPGTAPPDEVPVETSLYEAPAAVETSLYDAPASIETSLYEAPVETSLYAPASVETPRPLPLDRAAAGPDDDSDGDDAPPPWEDPRSPLRARTLPPALDDADDAPSESSLRFGAAEEAFAVQLPEPPAPESDAESDGMRAQQRHLDIWERFLSNAATRKFGEPRRDPAADKLLLAAAGDGYDDAEAARAISELLAEGTAPDASDDQGRRPLHHAAFAMALDRCQLLYDGGADVDARDKGGNRPLHVASARGATDVVAFLLGCAAAVDASNGDGDRPLHLSAWMGHAEATARLIEGEANVDALNGFGHDPLDNILERSPCVAKQRARLLAGKRPKPLPGPLRATVQILEAARVRRSSGEVIEEL